MVGVSTYLTEESLLKAIQRYDLYDAPVRELSTDLQYDAIKPLRRVKNEEWMIVFYCDIEYIIMIY